MHKQAWLAKAKEAGMEAFEIYESKNRSTSIRLYESVVDGYTISECKGICLRGLVNGKLGSCFLEDDSDELMDYAIAQVIANANAISSEDEVQIYGGDKEYPTITMTPCTIMQEQDERKIELLKQIEHHLLQSDERIVQVMNVNYGEVDQQIAIDNTTGSHLQDHQQMAFLSAAVMAKQGEDTKVAYDWQYIHDIQDVDAKDFAYQLAQKVVDKLGAESITSGSYPVLIEKEAMADILEAFSGMFNGENAAKGISLLKDKLQQQVCAEAITIVDDPLLQDGYNSRRFDDEGVACQKTTLMEHGVLKSYLHNLKSAKLMGTQTTGNGFKAGYAGNVGIAPTNLYIEAGSTSYADMVASMKKGIIITEVTGLHAGLNPMTGDFSLQSQGWYVEDGKKKKAINLFTVAGNFLTAMSNITCVGNDFKMNAEAIGAPSILFSSLAISGE